MRIISILSILSLILFTGLFNGCGGSSSGAGGGTPASSTITGTTSTGFSIGNGIGKVGDIVSIPVTLTSAGTTRAASCTVNFTPTIVAPGESSGGSVRDAGAKPGAGIACRRKWSTGSVTLLFVCGSSAATSTVAHIPFKIIAPGVSALTLTNLTAYDGNMQPITAAAKGRSGVLTGRK